MKDQKLVQEVYNKVVPLIQKMENTEDTNIIEYQLDAICENLTEEQNNKLDEMLESNGII
ncbi:hypothetical protein QOK74_08370 [Staphylococcus saprophyticus]|uniref:hypothetical protein n=1 Tax=Staphylococcus saprophyticus TaxID=29385 RepID=UPI0024C406C9|nr:hypothetical protein [Staphylococcus saprophyticus]MDK1672886.1 hypothetical protein [Staphylococcus saprophyticus]